MSGRRWRDTFIVTGQTQGLRRYLNGSANQRPEMAPRTNERTGGTRVASVKEFSQHRRRRARYGMSLGGVRAIVLSSSGLSSYSSLETQSFYFHPSITTLPDKFSNSIWTYSGLIWDCIKFDLNVCNQNNIKQSLALMHSNMSEYLLHFCSSWCR